MDKTTTYKMIHDILLKISGVDISLCLEYDYIQGVFL